MLQSRIHRLVTLKIKRDGLDSAPDQNADGPAKMNAFMAGVHDTYANFRIKLDASTYADDVGFVLWSSVSNGLKSNESTNAVEVSGISMLRFADGKMTEEIVHYDTATLNAQLGTSAVPHAVD